MPAPLAGVSSAHLPRQEPPPPPLPAVGANVGGEDHVSVEISDKSFKFTGREATLIIFGLLLIVGLLVYLLMNREEGKKNENSSNISININISLSELRQKLDKGVEEREYKIETFPSDEVVQGKAGSYYVIDLKDAATQERILFDSGKYTKDVFERIFRESMSKVKKEILDRLAAGNVPYKLYVRGSADILGDTQRFIDKLAEEESIEITYLPQAPNVPGQFLDSPRTQTIPKEYNNRQLPNLRAAYIQKKLKILGLESTILEGEVTQREDENDRSALILLFWPK